MILNWNKAVSDSDGTIGEALVCGLVDEIFDSITWQIRQDGEIKHKKVYVTSDTANAAATLGLLGNPNYNWSVFPAASDTEIETDLTGTETRYGPMQITANTANDFTTSTDPTNIYRSGDTLLWWDASDNHIEVVGGAITDNGNSTWTIAFASAQDATDRSGNSTSSLVSFGYSANVPKPFWIRCEVAAGSPYYQNEEQTVIHASDGQCGAIRSVVGQYVLTGSERLPMGTILKRSLGAAADYKVLHIDVPTGGTTKIFTNGDVNLYLMDSSEVYYPAMMYAVEGNPWEKFQTYLQWTNPSTTDAVTVHLIIEARHDINDEVSVIQLMEDTIGRYDKGSPLVNAEVDAALRHNSGMLAILDGDTTKLERSVSLQTTAGNSAKSRVIIVGWPYGTIDVDLAVYEGDFSNVTHAKIRSNYSNGAHTVAKTVLGVIGTEISINPLFYTDTNGATSLTVDISIAKTYKVDFTYRNVGTRDGTFQIERSIVYMRDAVRMGYIFRDFYTENVVN